MDCASRFCDPFFQFSIILLLPVHLVCRFHALDSRVRMIPRSAQVLHSHFVFYHFYLPGWLMIPILMIPPKTNSAFIYQYHTPSIKLRSETCTIYLRASLCCSYEVASSTDRRPHTLRTGKIHNFS
jgi:hypothetical protein